MTLQPLPDQTDELPAERADRESAEKARQWLDLIRAELAEGQPTDHASRRGSE